MSTPPPTLPPPVARLDYAEFRRKLAGLSDPDRQPGDAEKSTVRETAHRFVGLLPHVFGDGLDRTTLWDRIGSALRTACAKVSDGDLGRWASLVLEHIQAGDGAVSRCEPLASEIVVMTAWPDHVRQAFVQHVLTHTYAVLVHGRAAWERHKADAKLARESNGEGE